MVNYYIYRYMEGFATRRCLIVAQDEPSARAVFFRAHPRLRPYNLVSVAKATSHIYELAG